jgi:hypothetical protein
VPDQDGRARGVTWGWAWIDDGGWVRRVLWGAVPTQRPRLRAPRRFDSWTLLELTDMDVPVTVDEPVTAPEARPGS